MDNHNTQFILVLSLLSLLCQSISARQVLFKRQYGTLDFMYSSGSMFDDTYFPLQQAPIYGHECLNDDCSESRFLTVRYGSDSVIKFSNFRAHRKDYNTGRFFIRCPKKMLGMGTICSHGNCLKPQMFCGEVPEEFGKTSSKFRIVLPSNSSKVTTCPDSMYVSGLECATWNCIPIGLHCTELKMTFRAQNKHILRIAGNRKSESDLFSSKKGGRSEVMRGPIFKIECLGTVCNSLILSSVDRGSAPLLHPVEKWTNYVEDEGTIASCPSGTIVVQMECQKESCDKIRLGCARPIRQNGIVIEENDIMVSNIFGLWNIRSGFCPDGYYFKSLSCLLFACSTMVMQCVKVSFIQ